MSRITNQRLGDDMIIMVEQSDGEQRMIGRVVDKRFFAHRKKSSHLYRKLHAWGVDITAIEDLKEKGKIETIVVLELEEEKTYVVEVDKLLDKGEYLHFKPHRPQIFLPLKEWEVFTDGKFHDVL